MRTKNGPLRKSSCSAEAFGSRGFSTKLCASGDGGDLSANQIGRPDMARLVDLPAEWLRQHQMLGLPAR
jgi:hypothetical protein